MAKPRLAICYPTPQAPIGPYGLDKIRDYCPDNVEIRFDAMFRQEEQVRHSVEALQAYQFDSLPILGIHSNVIKNVVNDNDQINEYAQFCVDMIKAFHWLEIELTNEPDIMGHISPEEYRRLALAACIFIHEQVPECQVYLAGEMLQPNRRGPTPKTWFRDATRDFPGHLWKKAAVHNYRQPGSADVASIGGWLWGIIPGSRQAEHEYCLKESQGHGYIITETGWDLGRCSEEAQAINIIKELNYAEQFSIDYVAIYAYVGKKGAPGDFGIFEDLGTTWRPRPVIEALNKWAGQEEEYLEFIKYLKERHIS